MASSVNQSEVQIFDWFEGDASHFVPRPRPPRPSTPSPGEQAKARWLPVITQHTVPGEGSRLVVKKDEGCLEATILVHLVIAVPLPGDGASGKTVRVHEVSVDVPGLLGLWHRSAQHEEVQYVPWEAIAAVSFSTRK